MKRSVLEQLVEPDTGAPLALEVDDERDGDVLEGALRSSAQRSTGQRSTGQRYRIHHGIPSFVDDEVSDQQTVRSFAEKWDKHRYYREHTRRFYTEWYLQRFGFGSDEGLRAFLADKRTILDAGTGAGRDAQNFADRCDGMVFGVDTAWHALDNAASLRAEAPHARAVELVHADLHRLPFPDGYFDFINCDQVIHHTPDPPRAFACLAKKLRRGGQITTYVYRKKSVIRELVDDHVRAELKDKTFEEALAACEAITKLGKALSDLGATLTVPEDVPSLRIHKGTYDLQRFFHYNVMKCFWNDEFDFFTNNVVNADWYHPTHCFRYTPDELRAWFDDGFHIVAWDEQEAGISCRAEKR